MSWGASRCSGREALGVAREEGSLADVVQAAEQHHNPLQTHSKAPVRIRAVLEGVDVGLYALQGNLMRLRPVCITQ